MAHLVFYDGVCGFCNRGVRSILKGRNSDRFLFATLQSEFAERTLRPAGIAPSKLETMAILADYKTENERLLVKGRGALFVLRQMGGVYKLAWIFEILPTRILDWLYDCFANIRYRIFGRYDSCPRPSPEHISKFIE